MSQYRRLLLISMQYSGPAISCVWISGRRHGISKRRDQTFNSVHSSSSTVICLLGEEELLDLRGSINSCYGASF
jgi:hypothetical protein